VTSSRAFALTACIAACLSVSVGLTGCAGDAPAGGAPASEHAPASGEGSAAPAEIPADFPSKAVPLVDGELLKGSLTGGVYTVAFASDDTAASLADATAKLLAAGFAQTTTNPLYGDFSTVDYKVRVFVIEADKSITYLVTSLAIPTPEPKPTSEGESH